MKKILYTTSLVFLPSSFKRWIYGGNIMLYRISVTERGLTGIANIFRSRLSRLDDLLGAGTVPLKQNIRKRDRLFKIAKQTQTTFNWDRWRYQRNLVTSLNRRLKDEHLQNQINKLVTQKFKPLQISPNTSQHNRKNTRWWNSTTSIRQWRCHQWRHWKSDTTKRLLCCSIDS